MFIAGDPSGDVHASHVVRELKSRDPSSSIWGIGGPAMTSAGFEQVMPFEPFNCMGYVEVIKHLKFFLDAKKKLINMISTVRRPDVLVCVDYSGFNMPMMKAARELSIPVVWYIAPMVWAWKRKRAEILGEYASHIATIFPFENQYFTPYKAPVTFVGNPLVENMECGMRNLFISAQANADRVYRGASHRVYRAVRQCGMKTNAASRRTTPSLRDTPPRREISVSHRDVDIDVDVDVDVNSAFRIPNSALNLLLIPGSRPQEIRNMLGIMIDAAVMLREKCPEIKVTVSRFGNSNESLFSRAASCGFEINSLPLTELLRESDLALATSGTATLETALAGVPMVITYRTSRISYAIYRYFVKIKHIGLPNIVAEEGIVPECLQHDANPRKLSEELYTFVADKAYRENTVKKLEALRERLGEKKPSVEVADIVYSYFR